MTSSSVGDGNLGEQFQQTPQTAITAFLAKLWALVNDPTCDDLISWDTTGVSFHVYDQARFAREILPRYFKHNNFASFIRQLNMYGFRKISTIEHGSLKNERDDIEFAHPNFVRGHDALLENIKRRAPENQQKTNVQTIKTEPVPRRAPTPAPNDVSNPPTETKPLRAIEVGHLLDDVRSLHSKQNSLTDKLFHLEDENQALWREIGTLRQKHAKQQQIVTKLMEFLVHILSSASRHRRSVEQNPSNTSQQRSAAGSTIATTHSLKRKPAALMLSEEPSKRINRQEEARAVNPTSLFVDLTSDNEVEPRITINELTETDPGVWMPTNDDSPLVDLVPSPPPSIPTMMPINGNPSTQQRAQTLQPTAKFDWVDSSNNLSFPTSTCNIEQNDTFLPEFFLTPEQDQDPNSTHGQIIDDINTPCTSLQRKTFIVPLKDRASGKTISTNESSIHPNCSLGFSLDEFTGDVDHIQASLDNIREYMCNKLPDGTLIDDLFSDENVLLSPFLPTQSNLMSETAVENRTGNNFDYSSTIPNRASDFPILEEVLPHTAINTNENNTGNVDSTISQSDKNDSLLDQLINQNQTIEHQQQNQIKQLESDKYQLQARLNVLDRQKKN